MKYLLDTNVISETIKTRLNAEVAAFMNQLPWEALYISVITVGEIAKGIEKLPPGNKKNELTAWFRRILRLFENRIIPLDTGIMLEWGKLCAAAQRSLPVIDSLLAASALNCRLTILTRNVQDFEDIEGVSLLNPWET